MPTYILAPAAIIALTVWVAWRIDRAEQLAAYAAKQIAKQFADDFSDCDCRTASLADLINGGGETAREGAGGGGCAKASRLGSHTQTNRPSIAPSEQGSV